METKVKERGILFSAPMVLAILAGRKTQTRRIIKPQLPACESTCGGTLWNNNGGYGWHCGSCGAGMRSVFRGGEPIDALGVKCPYGQPGDRLWVRETWRVGNYGVRTSCDPACIVVTYKAGGQATFYEDDLPAEECGPITAAHKCGFQSGRWKPSIHMPRWASRITLEITDVRVERVQDISEDDAEEEGCEHGIHALPSGAVIKEYHPYAFASLWDNTNGKGAWERNDWVWVVEFKVVKD